MIDQQDTKRIRIDIVDKHNNQLYYTIVNSNEELKYFASIFKLAIKNFNEPLYIQIVQNKIPEQFLNENVQKYPFYKDDINLVKKNICNKIKSKQS